MNTCDTCKWWGDPLVGYSAEGTKVFAQRHCENELLNGNEDIRCGENGASAERDMPAWISTGPKFGCAHHEPKFSFPNLGSLHPAPVTP